ncbi:MAG: hypothetical protein WD295_03910, partial [Bacteroidota bacterium]
REGAGLSSSLAVSLRATTFTEEFRTRGNADSRVMLLRSETRLSPWQRGVQADVFYEFSNQRSARLERVFMRVPRGEGSYRYLGDLNNNGIADEEEFELTRFDGEYIVLLLPGEQLVPVGDVKASARIRIQPSRLISREATGLLAWIGLLSSETFFRIDERSSDERSSNVYLLRLGTFLNDRTTIAGSRQFLNDVYVSEGNPDFSLRLRIDEREGLIQLVGGTERSRVRERSLRVRAHLLREIGNQTDVSFRKDRVAASVRTPRERDIVGTTLESDFYYRPEPAWEVGFRFGVGNREDRIGGEQATADLNDQSVRAVYAFPGRGQLRAETGREEVVLTRPYAEPGKALPYELTGGRVVGKSFLWSLAFDYRITQNIQLSVGYNGRSEGKRTPVHTARAEARAFF